MPRLSIITVSYNSASTIEDAIVSVRAQQGADFEHIIIDGGSGDGTLEIIDKYRDGVACLVSEPDKGIYDAMNKGMKLATGEFVGCLNSDDYFAHPHALARIQRELTAGHLDCVWGDIVYVDAGGVPRRLMRGNVFRPWLLRFGIMPPHPSFYARTELIRQAGLFDPSYKIAGDFDLMVKLFQMPGIRWKYIDELTTVMRLGGVSTKDLSATRVASSELRRSIRSSSAGLTLLDVAARYPLKLKELLAGKMLALQGKRFPPGIGGADG